MTAAEITGGVLTTVTLAESVDASALIRYGDLAGYDVLRLHERRVECDRCA